MISRFIPELDEILFGERLAIWEGTSTRKTPAECEEHREIMRQQAKLRKAGGKPVTTAKPSRALGPAPLCIHRGGMVASPNGKPGWVQCNHGNKPLKTKEDPTGNKVCSCAGCGPKCSGYLLEGADSCLEVTAEGIGDHMQGMQLAAAWRRANPDQKLTFMAKPWCHEWIELFEGYDRIVQAKPQGALIVADCSKRANRHYVEEAANRPRVLPWPKPLPSEAIGWAEQFRGAVVLCPWGLTRSRWWPLSHWLYLERLIEEGGQRCVILDGRTDEKTRNKPFHSPVLLDESAVRVATVMALSAGVIGNESGMAHVAGMLRVPTVVLYAQLNVEPIYKTYPTVRPMRGPLACSGCRFGGANWQPRCDTLCASLALIQPVDVWKAFREITAPAPGFVADPVADRALDSIIRQVDGAVWHGRSRGLAKALRFLAGRTNPQVLETGCQRQDDDIGAGMFTTIAGRFLQAHGGHLISVDNNPKNVAFARSRTKRLPVKVIESDSADWLRQQKGERFDLIYLDSHDLTVPGFAEHCLEEAQAAIDLLKPDGLLMIDDTYLAGNPWSGKGQLAVPWLLAQGFELVWHGHQVILRKS